MGGNIVKEKKVNKESIAGRVYKKERGSPFTQGEKKYILKEPRW